MLSRLILTLSQLAIAWFGAPHAFKYLPKLGQLDIFLIATVFTVLVWIVGFAGSIVLKDLTAPSSSTLTATLVLALIGAGLTFVPQVTSALKDVPTLVYPLAGAILGYAARR